MNCTDLCCQILNFGQHGMCMQNRGENIHNGDKNNSRNILVIINVIKHFFVHQLAQLYGRIVYGFFGSMCRSREGQRGGGGGQLRLHDSFH